VHQHGPPTAVLHDTGGRAVVVFVGEILHNLGQLMTPTNTTHTRAEDQHTVDNVTAGHHHDRRR